MVARAPVEPSLSLALARWPGLLLPLQCRPMPSWLQRLGTALVVLLLLGYAHAPALTAGLSGGEFRTLLEVEQVLHPGVDTGLGERAAALFEVHGFALRPLAAASLLISRLVTPGPVGAGAMVLLRLENLLWLLVGALCFGSFVKRLLWSWVGSDQAAAAGRAAVLLIALQPLHGTAVASVVARGDLMALALGGAGCVLLLKGRRERMVWLTVLAALLAILAGAASRIALALPALTAVAEYTSARRYRARPVRLRTAGTTFLISLACVSIVPLLGELLGFRGYVESSAAGGSPLMIGLERLGVLVLPINATVSGTLGYALAGAVVLATLQPAFIAARSAPRLWGWMLVGWSVMVLLVELLSSTVRVHPGDVTRAATLLPASVTASVGLAVAATALSGLRRWLLPLAAAAAWAFLAHQNAGAWNQSARVVETFRSELYQAREAWQGWDARLLAIDPPRRVMGVEAVQSALPWMLDPLFAADPAEYDRLAFEEPPRVRAISSLGLAALAREVEFELLRSDPLVVVYPDPQGGSGRSSLRLEPVEAFSQRRSFFGEARKDLDVASAGARMVSARVSGSANTDVPPRLGWLAQGDDEGAAPTEHELTGTWLEQDDGVYAVFDLCASREWVLSQRIKMIYSARGWSRVEEGALLDALPAAEVEGPRVEGAAWRFTGADPQAGERIEWTFELLELTSLTYEQWPVRVEGSELWLPGVEGRIEALLANEAGPVVWSLLRRVDGVAVARRSGRRE